MHLTDELQTPTGQRLFVRRWTPETVGMKAHAVLVHGVHEHSGRHAFLASALVARGIAVTAYDQRGHGQSGGERGEVEAFNEFLDDLGHVLAEAGEATEGLPLFLVGHSMGGLVAASYVTERGADGLAGLVLSSPALEVGPASGPMAWAAPVLGPLVSARFPRMLVGPLRLDNLSRDPAVERQYREDPLNHISKLKARLAWELGQAAERTLARASAVRLPLLVVHGTADRICRPGGSERFVAGVSSADNNLRLFDGAYHETMKDLCRDEVVAAIGDWITDRAA